MTSRLVDLVKTAVVTVSLAALISCNPQAGPSYSHTPTLPDVQADVPGAVLNQPLKQDVKDSMSPDLDILVAPMPMDIDYGVVKLRGQPYLIMGQGTAVKQPEYQ